MFSGVGAQAMALRNLGVPFEYWKTSDWDVNSVASYKAIHHSDDNTDYSEGLNKDNLIEALEELCVSSDGKSPMTREQIARKGERWLRDTYNNFRATHNLGSVTGIHAEDLEIRSGDYSTIMTYSFPCQDISVAGRQAGFDKGSSTRSGLLWEVERILTECKELDCLPDILVMENVNAIHNKKNMPNFQKWLDFLDSIGYKSYWTDLNSKDFGVPQNRLRCFVVSLLSDKPYTFPEPIELRKRLKDYLEDRVDEKYYINNDKAQKLILSLIGRGVLPPRGRESVSTSQLTAQELGESPTACQSEQAGLREPAYLNYRKIEKTNVDIAKTLCARDWKGFGTGWDTMNGVIESD